MNPTEKSAGIDMLLQAMRGRSRVASVKQGTCMTCGAEGLTEASFRDPLSVKEYRISGMCQKCQDEVFG